MPPREQIRLWIEDEEGNFVQATKEVMQAIHGKDIQFEVHENSSTIRNFCLPYLDGYMRNKTVTEILNQIRTETGNDSTLVFFLPAEIIAKAFMDEDFKNYLIAHPNIVLEDWGYDTDEFTCVIHEDTEFKKNIIYRNMLGKNKAKLFNKKIEEDIDKVNKIRRSFSGGSGMGCHSCHGPAIVSDTTKCCATGTCD